MKKRRYEPKLDHRRRLYCENRPAMTYDEAMDKIESYGVHRHRMEPYQCEFCGMWHLRSHWRSEI